MSEIILKEGSTPSTPASGQVSLYAKDGGLLYTKDDLGIEKFVGGYFDGWTPINIAPVYVSATSIRFENINLSGAFPLGTKIKFTQTTVKYFYVIGVSYSGGHTNLTLTGGSDYTITNATITSFYYSHGLSYGFPEWFGYTVGASSASGALGTHTTLGRFRISGDTCHFYCYCAITANGTGGTYLAISYPIVPTYYRNEPFFGNAYNPTVGTLRYSVTGHIGFIGGAFSIYRYDGGYPGLDNTTIHLSGFYRI